MFLLYEVLLIFFLYIYRSVIRVGLGQVISDWHTPQSISSILEGLTQPNIFQVGSSGCSRSLALSYPLSHSCSLEGLHFTKLHFLNVLEQEQFGRLCHLNSWFSGIRHRDCLDIWTWLAGKLDDANHVCAYINVWAIWDIIIKFII